MKFKRRETEIVYVLFKGLLERERQRGGEIQRDAKEENEVWIKGERDRVREREREKG